jgi:hypothetical protein
LPSLRLIAGPQLLGGPLDGSCGRRPEHALLLSAQYQRGQLLAPGIGKQANQPSPEVVSNPWHITILHCDCTYLTVVSLAERQPSLFVLIEIWGGAVPDLRLGGHSGVERPTEHRVLY